MVDVDNELTFEMIGNTSEEEIKNEKDNNSIEITEELDNSIPSNDDNDQDEDIDNLFPEGVGDESQEDNGDAKAKSSPNLYSSIASSLLDDGILTLGNINAEDIQSPEDLSDLIKKQVDYLHDEDIKRVKDALNNEVPIDVIQQYENINSYLNSINEDTLKDESKEAEQLRGQIIVQDYLNKGFSNERANREAKKSFDAGTDIEDSIESLKDCKSYFTNEYNKELNKYKESKDEKLNKEKELSKKIEDKFSTEVEPIKGIKLSEVERKKILSQYVTAVDKDSNNKPINILQKYAIDNPVDYQYNINLLFYLTNGFKDLGTVINKEVKKKTKSSMSNLEQTLRNPSNFIGSGGLNFDNDNSPESYKGKSIDFS